MRSNYSTATELTYDFARLDNLLDMLHSLQLRPVIEVMGNPSGMFSGLKGDALKHMWIDLMTRVLQRYAGK